MGNTTIRNEIGYIFFKLYVLLCWNNNKTIQEKLDKDTAINLGYYLSNNTKKFNNK